MVNQQNKQQPCDHTLQRGPNAGCRCATYTSFVNAQGRRLCSKHKAAAPPATQQTPQQRENARLTYVRRLMQARVKARAAMTIQATYRDRRERLRRGPPMDLAALPGDALSHILDYGLDPAARRRIAQTCVAHRAAVEPCRVLDLGLMWRGIFDTVIQDLETNLLCMRRICITMNQHLTMMHVYRQHSVRSSEYSRDLSSGDVSCSTRVHYDAHYHKPDERWQTHPLR